MTRLTLALLAAITLLLTPSSPFAWEADTTHPGIVEQAALASVAHGRIETDLGIPGGLFARIIVPPADAPELLALLARFNPTHGFVPDGRGRQTALAWLAAGAAVADSPTRYAANHFLNPKSRRGLDDHTLGGATLHKLRAKQAGAELLRSGMPAHEWVVSAKNPLGLMGFLNQYEKAAKARTAGERERHLAGALIAAGAMAHVLGDMASPSHVRVDLAAHLDSLGPADDDVGSRFERIAGLAFGRLGVPGPSEIVRKDRLQSFFVAADGSGLAQIVNHDFPSRYTLPPAQKLSARPTEQEADAAIRRALHREDVAVVRSGTGYRVVDARGVCVAMFERDDRELRFFLEDDCVISQLQRLLPLATGYTAGLLDHLFRGRLGVRLGPTVSVDSNIAIGDGELTLLWEDRSSVRTVFHTQKVSKTLHPSGVKVPGGATRVVAVFRGTDHLGEALVAVGSSAPSP